jgi:hypothetical protein
MKRSEFQSVLNRFCTRIYHEETIVFITGKLAELFSDCFLKGVLDRIGIESQIADLALQAFHIMRMAVADRDNCMTSIQVKVFLIVLVPYPCALTFGRGDVE